MISTTMIAGAIAAAAAFGTPAFATTRAHNTRLHHVEHMAPWRGSINSSVGLRQASQTMTRYVLAKELGAVGIQQLVF
jgi:hypothetical protein